MATTTSTRTLPGRSWHHYPLQRWKGLEHEELQYGSSRDALLNFPAGSLMYEIESTWRWPRVVGKVEADPKNPLEYAKLWRIAQARAAIRQARQVRDVLVSGPGDLPRQPHLGIRPRGQEAAHLGHGHGHEQGASTARSRRRQGHPDRGAHDPLHGLLPPRGEGAARLHGRGVQSRGGRARRRRAVDPHLLGQPEHAEGLHAASRTRIRSTHT